MIVRILTEGQFDVPDDAINALNVLDDRLQEAVEADDENALSVALGELLDRVRELGTAVPAEEIVSSDLVLPYSDATLAEVRDLLDDEGLIPGRGSDAPVS